MFSVHSCDLWEDLDEIDSKSEVAQLQIKNQSVPFVCDYPAFKQFPNLESLQFEDGAFTEITNQCFEGVPKLMELHLNNHSLQAFDLTAIKAEKVKKLALHWNKIKELNFNGTVLPELISLGASENNLTEINIKRTNCPNLRILYLDGNQIRRFHVEGDKLFAFSLGNNSIENFNGTDLIAPNLDLIYMTDNRIKNISSQMFSQSPKIDSAYFDNNPIEAIDLSSFNISRLNCESQQLLVFKENRSGSFSIHLSWTKVSQLKLSFNYLKTCEIFKTKDDLNVEQLLLNDNKIEKILKTDLKSVPKLIDLDLSNNRISDIQDGALDRLTNLHSLKLKGNMLKTITENLFTQLNSIVSINLSNNELRVIPLPGWNQRTKSVEMQSYHVSFNEICITFSLNIFLQPLINAREFSLFENPLSCNTINAANQWMKKYNRFVIVFNGTHC